MPFYSGFSDPNSSINVQAGSDNSTSPNLQGVVDLATLMNNSGNFKFWPDSNLLMSFDSNNQPTHHMSPDGYFNGSNGEHSSLDDLSFATSSPLSLDENNSIASLLAHSNQPSPITNLLNFASPLAKSNQFNFNNILGDGSLPLINLNNNSISAAASAAAAAAASAAASASSSNQGRSKRVSKKKETAEEVKPPKLRQKKAKFEDISSDLDDKNADGSIIKRRKKNELQILVENPSHVNNANNPPSLLNITPSTIPSGLLTSVIKTNNLQGFVGSVNNPFGDLNSVANINHTATPSNSNNNNNNNTNLETPQRKSSRLKSLNSFSSLSNLSGLDSPFDPSLFSNIDTPSRFIDPALTKSNFFMNDVIKFDFDEAVAGHFPSPRAGEFLKGASPSRWCSSTVGNNSNIFNFSEPPVALSGKSALSTTNSSTSSNNIATPKASSGNTSDVNSPSEPSSIYLKKFKKAHKTPFSNNLSSPMATSTPSKLSEGIMDESSDLLSPSPTVNNSFPPLINSSQLQSPDLSNQSVSLEFKIPDGAKVNNLFFSFLYSLFSLLLSLKSLFLFSLLIFFFFLAFKTN